MKDKFKRWCYGGESPITFKKYEIEIHKYNSKMMHFLLLIMTILMGCYVMAGSIFEPLSKYSIMHWVYFITMLLMLFVFRWKVYKHILATKLFIILFSVLTFIFVCAIGTFFERNMMAVMIIVYTLALPMILIIPTHYMFSFLTVEIVIFCICSLTLKDFRFASLDIVNAITCLAIGLFVSQRILESRVSLLVANQKLEYLSKIDALTEVPNRLSLDQYIQQIYTATENFTLAILDLDDFKKFNDIYGHHEGDNALKLVARTIKEHGNTSDFFVARFGGEEFVILNISSDSYRIATVLDEIRQKIEKQDISGHSITASIGYAEKLEGESFDTLFERADKALYCAKASGKNCVIKSD